ncbi:MAG TPA: FAD-dependent oxidoreductase [Anaerolineales bacterium]|jgi:ferredoxin--NADP+ reductase|nr:FAD-dependent oxidoreductase [Anaerolineales bacterium]
MQETHIHPVAVIGAGPAGLFAARQLAEAGMPVALINRDVKPGGLAEYGIYYDKYKMKLGLRKQFQRIMEQPGLHYFGNLTVSEEGPLTLKTLKDMGFKSVMVTVGAQGTKWLGMPGEALKGAFHAKDLVYHYNQLPPFSSQQFEIGDKVMLIGAGNVMVDIARYCVHDLKVKEVTAVVRRGPADVKFDKKELESIVRNIDLDALDAEIERTGPVLEAVGQNPADAKAFLLSALFQAKEKDSETIFNFRFLASPTAIVGDDDGNVTGLEVEHTTLKLRDNGSTGSVSLGTTEVLDADTVIFCIGDRVSQNFGLPLDRWQEYAKHPEPRFPVDGISYEAYTEVAGQPVEGIFLSGWAREASSGLVGTAKKDGEKGAQAMLQYLDTLPAEDNPSRAIEALENYLVNLPGPVVRKADYLRLAEVEAQKADELGIEMYKFTSNEEMFEAMGLIVTG